MLRTLSDRTTVTRCQYPKGKCILTAESLKRGCRRTFILSYILESECEAGVLALNDADLSERTFADNTQQTKVVEVNCQTEKLALGLFVD
jgi:hypothetical protein